MPDYRRANVKGGTYFFTVATYRRRPILCVREIRTSLREGIRTTQAKLPFTINAWVLLPDHLHCIWTLPRDDANFSARWAMIKRFVSQKCGSKYHGNRLSSDSKIKRHESTIWQRRFWEHQIRDEQDLNNHLNYLHFNPVKHGHVNRVVDWPYSTFHRFVNEGKYEKDWGREVPITTEGGVW